MALSGGKKVYPFPIFVLSLIPLVAQFHRGVSVPLAGSGSHLTALGAAQWKAFKQNFGKSFSDEAHERIHMESFFKENSFIATHNARFMSGKVGYEMGINEFTDMTEEEMAQLYGFRRSTTSSPREQAPKMRSSTTGEALVLANANDDGLPQSVDWRDGGQVTPVKKQGSCGSCWAFSSTGAIEAAHARATGQLIPRSEQALMDCSWDYGNQACSGGAMDWAFQFVIEQGVGGLPAAKNYSYEGRRDQNAAECHLPVGGTAGEKGQEAKEEGSAVILTSYVALPTDDEMALKRAVATVGPVSVAVQVTKDWRHYKQGVFYDETCVGAEGLNHGVLVVGYGTDEQSGFDYWLVKNSWGENWGDRGYIKMARNRGSHCGIANFASYPIAEDHKSTL